MTIVIIYFTANADAPNVQVLKMAVVVDGREDIELDLTGQYQNLVKAYRLSPVVWFAFPISRQL